MENNNLVTMLKEFIGTFEASIDPELWLKLVKEEAEELQDELDKQDKVETLKEMTDLMYVTIGFNLTVTAAEQFNFLGDSRAKTMMETIKESASVYEKAIDFLGTDVDYGEAFRRVHLSNMSKIGEDGKPIKREDGKILKGPNYREPNLEDLV